MKFTHEMIAAAKACLVAQLQRWDAELQLETLFGGDLDTEESIKGRCSCMDAPEDVTDEDALQLLAEIATTNELDKSNEG